MIFSTCSLAIGGTIASGDAVVVAFGTDEVWNGLRIFGDVGRQAIDGTHTVEC
jgi:hypothetical protein